MGKQIMMRWFRVSVLTLLLAFYCPIGQNAWEGGAVAETSRSAAAFELITFAGEEYNNDSIKGRPVLLVFWAPWCRVCQRELPLMREFYQRDKPARLRMLSIGFADTRTNVDAFVNSREDVFLFPTAYDEERWVAQVFKVNATPTYVLVDGQGNIVLVHRGGGILQNFKFREFLSGLEG
jgi:thiol-disulfide isomerase/thioredoxin